jgi:hypothetical protein
MTLPFRFFRGEFSSGFFLFNTATFLNNIVTLMGGVYDEIMYWLNVQFEIISAGGDDIPMRTSDVMGIATTAGVFPLFFEGGYWSGALFFTESAVYLGKQRSERGLYDINNERFVFVRTDNDDYPDDIVTLASPSMRQSLIPHGQTILGYTRADQPVYDENGDVIWANVYATPPVGVAYDVFYGPSFATLSIDAIVISQMGIDFTMNLFIIMQHIRYNGATLQTFLDLTALICQDVVSGMSITQGTLGGRNYFVINYHVSGVSTADRPQERLRIWQYVVNQKFKLYLLNELPGG